MNLTEIIEEFKKYDASVIKLYHPAEEKDIYELENIIKYKLPDEFKKFLMITNGAEIDHQPVYGIHKNKPGTDLYSNFKCETEEAGNPMYNYLLPIMPDGMGNHNCLDLKSLSDDGMTCSVIFWQHDRLYDDDSKPDIDASTFTDFLEYLLNSGIGE